MSSLAHSTGAGLTGALMKSRISRQPLFLSGLRLGRLVGLSESTSSSLLVSISKTFSTANNYDACNHHSTKAKTLNKNHQNQFHGSKLVSFSWHSREGPPVLKRVQEAASDLLASHQVSDADISARYICSQVMRFGYSPREFDENAKRVLTDKELKVIVEKVNRRLQREPLQYILGDWDFYGNTFLCRRPILIPRPETEALVDHVLHSIGIKTDTMLDHEECFTSSSKLSKGKLTRSSEYPWRILDIGSGSGVIGITLLTLLRNATCTAIDVDSQAISLSRENADNILGQESSRYFTQHCSIQEFALRKSEQNKFDLIVSNPPYIPSEDMAVLEPEVINYESHCALDGGADGLDIIRDIITATPKLFRSDFTCGLLWLEASHSHPDAIEAMLSKLRSDERHPRYELRGKELDQFGRPRFVCLQLKQ